MVMDVYTLEDDYTFSLPYPSKPSLVWLLRRNSIQCVQLSGQELEHARKFQVLRKDALSDKGVVILYGEDAVNAIRCAMVFRAKR